MCFGRKPKVQYYGQPAYGARPYNPYGGPPMKHNKHRYGHSAAMPVYIDSSGGGGHHGHHGHHGGGGGWFGGD
ncbi:hypothetical protein IFR04_006000, partial [Cadophora malorum]